MALTEKIAQLGSLVNEFDHPFPAHPVFLGTYKKVKITCVGSFAAEQQLQWRENLKFNTYP